MRLPFRIAPLLLVLFACQPAPSPPPQVFVFLVDTLRADHTGPYGYGRDTTPQLDRFAEDAFVMHGAYSPSPWTRPAIASLFTGLPPALHGVRGGDGWLPGRARSWAEAMVERGYRTAGWYTNGHLEPHFGLHQGFGHWSFEQDEGRAYLAGPRLVERWAEALDGADGGAPRFHYLHLLDPHLPYQPARPHRIWVRQPVPGMDWWDGDAETARQIELDYNNYDAEVHMADAAFGRFLAELESRGWLEDSWVVFLSDHGEEFREHGVHGHGHGLYESLLRVPLVVRPPGGRQGPYAAGLAALEGAALPLHALADLVGASLEGWGALGLANLDSLGLPPEARAFVPVPTRLAPPLRRASFQLDGRGGVMVARGQEKLVWDELPEPGHTRFDLAADPRELRPLGGRPPAGLAAELQVWSELSLRGTGLRWEGPPGTPLRLECAEPSALQELRVPADHLPGELRFVRAADRRHVQWRPTAGGRIVLRTAPGARLWVAVGDAEPVGLGEGDPPAGLLVEELGPRRDPGGAPGELPAALREQLRALGYIE